MVIGTPTNQAKCRPAPGLSQHLHRLPHHLLARLSRHIRRDCRAAASSHDCRAPPPAPTDCRAAASSHDCRAAASSTTVAPPEMRWTKRRVVPAGLAISGGLIVTIGPFLPWVTFTGSGGSGSLNVFEIPSVKSTGYWIVALGVFAAGWAVLALALKRESRIRRNFFFRVLDRSFIPVAGLCGWGLYDSQKTISDIAGGAGGYYFSVGFWAVAIGGTLIFISGFFFDRGDRVENLLEGVIDVFLR